MKALHQNSRIYFADFETTTTNTKYYKKHQDSIITMWVLNSLQENRTMCGCEMLEFINNLNTLENDSVVYFHNLKFDGRFIWTYLVDNDWLLFSGRYDEDKRDIFAETHTDKDLPKDRNCFTMVSDGANIYLINLFFANGKRINIKCSYKLLPISIKAMGECIGISKHNEETLKDDFYDVEPSTSLEDYPVEYVKYAIRDVEILRTFFKDIFIPFLDSVWEKYEFDKPMYLIPLTIGALSEKIQRKYILKHHKDIYSRLTINDENEYIARHFYRGGLTLYNDNILHCKKYGGVYIDINSAYPFAMLKPLPYGPALKFKPSGEQGKDYLTFYHIYVKCAKIKNKKGLKPLNNWISKNNSLPKKYRKTPTNVMFQEYNESSIEVMFDFDAFYMEDELKVMEKFYNLDYEIVETYYVRCRAFLKDYTNILYEYKENAKDKGFKTMIKLLLNNGYGKYGQDVSYDEMSYCLSKEDYEKRLNKVIAKNSVFDKWGNYVYDKEYTASVITKAHHLKRSDYGAKDLYAIKYMRTNCDKIGNPNVWTAAAITAYNRIYLMNAILQCGNDIGNVLYCDTDSLILLDKGNYLGWGGVKLHPSKLGDWGIEGYIKEVIILNKKVYKCVLQDENGNIIDNVKAKGINKDIANKLVELATPQIDENGNPLITDVISLVDGKKLMKRVKSGWVLITKDINVKNNPKKSKMYKVKEHRDGKVW